MEEITQITLNDIYKEIDQYLNSINYSYLNQELRKEAIETGLKKYTVYKIKEANDSLMVNESMELYRLVEILSFLLNNNKEELSHLINFIIIAMSNDQRFAINWYEEEIDEYVNQPIIQYSNNVITKITTNKNGNLTTLFNYLNNYYVNEFNKNKTR